MHIWKFTGKRAGTLTCGVAIFTGLFFICAMATYAAKTLPSVGEKKHVKLVGYNDLQGRETLQVTTRGDWVYAGHHDNYWDDTQRYNPITELWEWNGTSILDISNPANPVLVWHIPNEYSANSRSVQVVYDYMDSGSDYLIRNSEGDGVYKYQIFDITERDTDPSQIHLVGEILGTPIFPEPGNCGPECGGVFEARTHKGWWSSGTGLFYATIHETGFRSAYMGIFDLNDPYNPTFVSRAWLYSQKNTEPDLNIRQLHHPIVDEANNRVYGNYRPSGEVVVWDISDPANPSEVWVKDTKPPGREVHTCAPVVYDDLTQYFGDDALPRTFLLVADEAGGADMGCTNPVRTKMYMWDISSDENPFSVASWQVPNGDFCEKGGRFGPHQFAETRDGELNLFADKLVWVPYFNAGARVVDISDPYHMKEVGYYIPEANENSHPVSEGQPTVIQINDIDVDYRGLAYASDRAGAGLFVLEYTGK